MTAPWQPFREPVRSTALRTGGIALVVGTVLALTSRGRISWPMAVVLVLWISLGGHFIEIWYLNWLRRRLPVARGVQIAARLAVWFLGGVTLAFAMALTARAMTGVWPARRIPWWVGGFAFIAVELIAHVGLHQRKRPGIYDGRG